MNAPLTRGPDAAAVVPRRASTLAASIAVSGTMLFVLDRGVLSIGATSIDAAGLAALWSIHTVIALLVGLVGPAWVAMVQADQWIRRAPRAQPLVAGLLLAAIGAAPLYWVCATLTRGDWIARQPYAAALKFGGLAAGMLALGGLGWLCARTWNAKTAPSPRQRRVLVAVLLGAATVVTVVDARVLPGLYPALHLAFYGVCVSLTLLAASRLVGLGLASRPSARRSTAVAAGMLVGIAVAGVVLSIPGNRGQLALGSPRAALVLPFVPAAPARTIANALERMDLGADDRVAHRDDPVATAALLGGRHDYNILFVLVDTLRADAVPPGRGPGRAFAGADDTPFLDAWLAGTYRFHNVYSQSSCTRPSLRPTFRSLETSDDVARDGTPLGLQATALGMTPFAVVPPYIRSDADDLLIGFEDVVVYQKHEQEVVVDRVRALLAGLAGRRFFAWVHFYALHDPYFAGAPTNHSDGSVAQRYQKALRWVDGEIEVLIRDLESSGLAENTVIVFAADHGENLGELGKNGHGGTVSEIEVRVPLSIYIPGQPGGDIETFVGNVDLVPTILDIAGAPPSAIHRGRSLLPVIVGADDDMAQLYFQNSKGDMHGVAIGANKLVRRAGGTFHRYDTVADPSETRDLYDPEGEIDRALQRAMLHKNPALFAGELRDPGTRALLERRLAELAPDAPAGPAHDLLVQLAALAKDPRLASRGSDAHGCGCTAQPTSAVHPIVLIALVAMSRRRSRRTPVAPRTPPRCAAGVVLILFASPLEAARSSVVAETLAGMDLRRDANIAERDVEREEVVPSLLGQHRDFNVLLVVVDALRADAVAPGRGEGTLFDAVDTPFLDAWLARAFRFRRAYSQSTCAKPSLSRSFRSLEASDDFEAVGVPLGEQVRRLGMTSFAVLPPYFTWSEAQHMHAGFERLAIYPADRQEVLIDRARGMFASLAGRRFFGWIHFYALHDPIYAGRRTTQADGTVAERYTSALGWLDEQLERLVHELERAGLADDTVIIFTADHGENLGERGATGHGATVGEAEVRVPLAIFIPGRAGGEVDGVVGNLDIVPTILDLARAPANPTHRGRSLLPLVAGAEQGIASSVPHYFETWQGDTQGVVIGTDKLVRYGDDGAYARFDLVADPAEQHNLHGTDRALDATLETAMLRKKPALFSDELADPRTRELLRRRLDEAQRNVRSGPDLELLLKLAELSGDSDLAARAARIDEASP